MQNRESEETATARKIRVVQQRAIRSVSNERVLMQWQIGWVIQEEEPQGKEQVGYGEFLIKSLSETLKPSLAAAFLYGNWKCIASFIAFSQI